MIGPPQPTPIRSNTVGNVTTTLNKVGNEFVISTGAASVVLSYNNTPIGTNGVWKPIGAVQTGQHLRGGVAASAVPASSRSGPLTAPAIMFRTPGIVFAGTSVALESAELTFNQDLNGDNVIGPPQPTPIRSNTVGNVTTTLNKVGNEFVISTGRAASVVLSYNNTPIGTNGVWKPIGAVQTGNTYEVALHLANSNEFQILDH